MCLAKPVTFAKDIKPYKWWRVSNRVTAVWYSHFYFMRRAIIINSEEAFRIDYKLDVLDLAILDIISYNIDFGKGHETINGDIFAYIPLSEIRQELPPLNMEDRSIRTRITKLERCGLIKKFVNHIDGNRPYYSKGKNYSKLFRL